MGLVSANVMIASLSLLHITTAYFLHYSPVSVTRHGFVLVLSSAFQLPISPSLDTPSTPLTLAALLLALVGWSDLFACAMPDPASAAYWGTQAPVRTFFFLLLAVAGWYGGPRGAQTVSGAGGGSSFTLVGGLPGFQYGPFAEGLVFSWAFLEALAWFLVFITLRDERRNRALKEAEKLAASR